MRFDQAAFAAVAASCALSSFSIAAGPLWSEFINGDLPNFPNLALPPQIIPSPGVTWVAQGAIGMNAIDVDFITIVVPFATNRLLIDLDTNFNHQDSVLGVASFLQYPTNPSLINEDDLNVLDDLTCGHATVSTDSLVDVTTILGSPLPANSVFTIAIGRTGEQFIGWTGAGSQMAKLEYQLYVYTEVVPGPGMAGAFGIGGLMVIGRRKRN